MTGLMLFATAVVAGAIGAGATAGWAVRRWVAAPAGVESVSMAPTLRPGRRLLVRRLRAGESIARGEVVVIRSAELGRDVVKRVIGLGGERIYLGADGAVRVNGRPLDEPYARPAPGVAASYAVPTGTLFLLGDNRAASNDSRRWRQPFIPESAVLGRVG